MDRIDFRSDTVTWPTAAMRAAMAAAPVGDDVYGEDPTVNQLQQLAAEKTGKEAALFVASGTMGNLTAVLTHAGRGDEMIVGHDSHVMLWEAGSVAALGGVVPLTLPTDEVGKMDPDKVAASIRPWDDHLPRTRLIHLENSYGEKHGYPIEPAYVSTMADIARANELSVHLDGARLFNAAVSLGIDVREITRHVDSLSFCVSKGLCAPVGSLLCGSNEFIARARRTRKALGGGMRQAGILAAAGMIALNEMVDRLADDHCHACQLAEGLVRLPGIHIDPASVRTNLVFFDLDDEVSLSPQDVIAHLQQEANIWLGTHGERGFRAVTHYWIGQQDVTTFLDVLGHVING